MNRVQLQLSSVDSTNHKSTSRRASTPKIFTTILAVILSLTLSCTTNPCSASNGATNASYAVASAAVGASAIAAIVAVLFGNKNNNSATLASNKAITAYAFANFGATGTINETAKTITVAVPFNTNVTNLVATFTTTGASITVGSTSQVSGVTSNNFTNPVIYTVTAADGSTASYTVTVSNMALNIHSFVGGTSGINPQSNLIQGTDGNFYGTTRSGGTSNLGTVFKISAGVYSTLHSFTGGTTDGVSPQAGLIQGTGSDSNNFYGTTYSGGTYKLGTVFKIDSTGTSYTLLHSFAGNATAGNATDGANPWAGLVQGTDGNFYGTTTVGGASNLGTVFKITPAGICTLLHSFAGGTSDGAGPKAGLVLTSDGYFYGTTNSNGTSSSSAGTVFKITSAGESTYSTVHNFAGAASSDGGNPYGALILGSDGNLYGTTYYGSETTSNNYGTVFRISPSDSYDIIYSFTGGTSSKNPQASLVQSADGNSVYGTTIGGGVYGHGTVFNLTLAGANYTLLHSFADPTINNDGAAPQAGLVRGTDGNFYGTTTDGGTYNLGTVFQISSTGTPYNLLYNFTGGTTDGVNTQTSLVRGTDGNFYGTTTYGGPYNAGTIFKINSTGTSYTPLYNFTGGTNGARPSRLVQGTDGYFYGITSSGGTYSHGTVFKINSTGASSYTPLHSFGSVAGDGIDPFSSGLIQGTDGNFYGTTASGGAYSSGTIFKCTSAGVCNLLYSFIGAPSSAGPQAGVIQGTDGNLYGTTNGGGASNKGTVFKCTLAGTHTLLYSFGSVTNDGTNPSNSLIQGTDGYFYGTTVSGGTYSNGTVFKINSTATGTTTYNLLYSFTGGTGGKTPQAGLIQGTDGYFYGTTYQGGTFNLGEVFKITSAGVHTPLYSFTGGTDSAYPYASLIQDSYGILYGTTLGGVFGAGTVFKMSPS